MNHRCGHGGLEKKSRLLGDRERRVVAYHEMGHALVAASLPGTDPVHKVSIIPRGIGALGYTMQRPTEDRFLMTREELLDRITVYLGGRAAEQLVFEQISTGAADDLDKSTDIARSMATRYGMVPELGHVRYEKESSGFLGQIPPELGGRSMSEQTAREIDQAVRELIHSCMERAQQILERNRALLEESSELLLEKETLSEPELERLFERLQPVVETRLALALP